MTMHSQTRSIRYVIQYTRKKGNFEEDKVLKYKFWFILKKVG